MVKKTKLEQWVVEEIFCIVEEISKDWQKQNGANFGEVQSYRRQVTNATIDELKKNYITPMCKSKRYCDSQEGKAVVYLEKNFQYLWFGQGKITFGEREAMLQGRIMGVSFVRSLKFIIRNMKALGKVEVIRARKLIEKKLRGIDGKKV